MTNPNIDGLHLASNERKGAMLWYDGTAWAAVSPGTSGQALTFNSDGEPVWGSVAASWPVGSVYIAVVSTNPATLLGFGTWAAFGTGRMLVGIDTGNAAFDTVEETGGSATQADHTGHGPHGDHDAHTLITDALALGSDEPSLNESNAVHEVHTNNGAISAHGTNLPPYIVVYMWKRTA